MTDNQLLDLTVAINEYPLDVQKLKLNKPFSQEIFLMNTYIAGLQFVRGIKRMAERLEEGEELKLVREPKNEYDELAIVVKTQQGKKLGYIPRKKNEVIARLLDAGKRIIGKVNEVRFEDDNENPYWDLSIFVDVFLID